MSPAMTPEQAFDKANNVCTPVDALPLYPGNVVAIEQSRFHTFFNEKSAPILQLAPSACLSIASSHITPNHLVTTPMGG